MSLQNFSFVTAARRGWIQTVRQWLQNGTHPDKSEMPYGNTALHEASKHNHLEIVKLLLEYGASASIENIKGKTPLDLAKMRGNRECATILVNEQKHRLTTVARYPNDELRQWFAGVGVSRKLADIVTAGGVTSVQALTKFSNKQFLKFLRTSAVYRHARLRKVHVRKLIAEIGKLRARNALESRVAASQSGGASPRRQRQDHPLAFARNKPVLHPLKLRRRRRARSTRSRCKHTASRQSDAVLEDDDLTDDDSEREVALALAEQERADEENEREIERALVEEGFKEKQSEPEVDIPPEDGFEEPEALTPVADGPKENQSDPEAAIPVAESFNKTETDRKATITLEEGLKEMQSDSDAEEEGLEGRQSEPDTAIAPEEGLIKEMQRDSGAEEEGLEEKQSEPEADIVLADERPESRPKALKLSKLASVQLLQNIIRGRQRLLLLEAQEPKEPEPVSKPGRFGSLKELLASREFRTPQNFRTLVTKKRVVRHFAEGVKK